MDSKRLTEIEERCEKATSGRWYQPYERALAVGGLSLLGLDKDDMAIVWERADADFIAHARTDLPDLVAAYKLLRADAAELARNAQRLYQILQPERDETRALNDAMNGGHSARFDLSEQHMFANLKASLSRPSVINLLKEKDQ